MQRWSRLTPAATLLLALLPVVRAGTAGSLRPKGPLYPDQSEDLGSISHDQATKTEEHVAKEAPKKPDIDSVVVDLTGMECDQIKATANKIMYAYQGAKADAFWTKFEASKANSKSAKLSADKGMDNKLKHEKGVTHLLDEAQKATELSQALYSEGLRVVEAFGLKCGATDRYCTKSGKDLIDKFAEFGDEKASAEALMVEAGWLKAESEAFGTTPEIKKQAKDREDEAWRKAGDVWDYEQRVVTGIMIKAAACGLRPPRGPWGDAMEACNLKPEDPVMRALLKEDPQEFLRRWKEEIAEQIGISPNYVNVDVSGCFPDAAPTTTTGAPA